MRLTGIAADMALPERGIGGPQGGYDVRERLPQDVRERALGDDEEPPGARAPFVPGRAGRACSAAPTRNARSAVIAAMIACSRLALFLTTEAVIADKPEKNPAPAGDPSGGMGGMDF